VVFRVGISIKRLTKRHTYVVREGLKNPSVGEKVRSQVWNYSKGRYHAGQVRRSVTQSLKRNISRFSSFE
jgi:hypothetical protein